MQVIFPCCAGLDVHKKTVVACVLRTLPDGTPTREVRSFGTTTRELLQLLDWLLGWGCSHVAMESTGVYWRPIYNLLEGHLEIWLVNALHCKNVPGRKTDVKDAEWLADLLRHGLVRPSFVPQRPQRELRDLTRARCQLVADRASRVNRIQQVLEGANIKLSSVLTNVTGVSGRAMLEALVAGETTPERLAECARGKARAKHAELVAALEGQVGPHQQFLLRQLLAQVAFLEEQIATFDAQIAHHIEQLSTPSPAAPEDAAGPADSEPPPPAAAAGGAPSAPPPRGGRRSLPPETPPTWAEAVALLDPIPGIGVAVGRTILAEIGVQMAQFPSCGHLTSWAGVSPGNRISAGKRYSGKTTPGNPALRQALVQAAHGAIRTKGCFFQALYHRLAARRGKKRAVIAVARHLLVVIYHVLLYQEPYRELGQAYYDERRKDALLQSLMHRISQLGYQANLTPLPAAA
jgi:transposase